MLLFLHTVSYGLFVPNLHIQTPVGANPARKVTRQELAAHLGITTRYVDHLVARHVIPVIRLGRRCTRFDLARVEEALSKYEVQAA